MDAELKEINRKHFDVVEVLKLLFNEFYFEGR